MSASRAMPCGVTGRIRALTMALVVCALTAPLGAAAQTRPDLVVTDLRLAPPVARARDSVTATVTIRNSGAGPADAALVALYFAASAQTPLDLATPLGTTTTPSLAPGASAALPVTFAVPSVPPGTFQIFAVVDAPSRLAETSETNNRRSAEFQVTFPDLTVQDLRLSPPVTRARDSVTATVTIRNSGRVPADPAPIALYVAPSADTPLQLATPIGTTTTPTLPAGASAPLPVTFPVPDLAPGTFRIIAVIDAPGRLAETSETNNRRSAELQVTFPDLTVQDLRLSPPVTRARDSVTATVTIRNSGRVPADPAPIALYVAPSADTPLQLATPIGTTTTPTLPAGGSAALPVTFSVPNVAPGTFQIVAVVDGPGRIAETSNANNRRATSLRVTFPDLTPSGLSLAPSVARARDAVTATVTVRNAGPVPADAASVNLYFAPSAGTPLELATPLGSTTTPVLPAGASTPLPVAFHVPDVAPGTFQILAVIDAAGGLAETNNANNRRATSLRVTFPDLTPSALSLAPAVARAGDSVTATLTVRNAGAVAADAAPVALYFARSAETPLEVATLLGSTTTAVLPAGASAPLLVTFRVPNVAPGSFQILAVLDAAGRLAETNNANNRRAASFQVALPDLRADALTLSPTIVRAADVVSASVTVRNGGAVPAAKTTGALFVLPTSATATQTVAPSSTFDIPELGPGKTVALKVPVTVPVVTPGSYNLLARLDPSLAVGESNDTNNSRTARFDVAVPDVAIADLSVDPSLVQPGQAVVANLRVGNAGRVASRPTSVVVFLATNPDAPLSAGVLVATLPVDTIPANGSLRLTSPMTIPSTDPGAYYLIAQIDTAAATGPWAGMVASTVAVTPSSQFRRKAIKLTVQMPDLTVSELSLDSTQLRPGTTVGAAFTVKNIGSATAPAHVAALLFKECSDTSDAGASVLKTFPVPSLAAGASTRLTTTVTAPAAAPGTHCVTARADSGRTVVEAVESNNDRSVSIQINDINVALVNQLDPGQLDVPNPYHSHYKHPWRGWLETMPASAYLDGLGLNYHVDTYRVRHDVEMRLLAESGIARIRIEIGWGRTDYDTLDLIPSTKTTMAAILSAAKANGIRPLILLNGHHGYPVPHRELTGRTVSTTAGAGNRTLQLNDVSGIKPSYTGLSNLTGYKMAEVIITAVNTSSRTVTLSKPLPVTLGAGQSVKLDTLRYQPLSEPGTAAYEETVAGWLAYVRTSVRAVIAAGITDFDVEIWNELTFGSDFLKINNYYSPPIVPDQVSLQPGKRSWELARRTVAMLAAEYPRVTPIWGFSNTTFFNPQVPSLPPGMLGQSYHPYEFAEYDSFADEHQGIAYNLEGYAPPAPPYRVVMPEGAGMYIRPDGLVRHLTPNGRQERPPSSPVFRHYMTEWGFNPSGYGVTDVQKASYLKAKALLRASFFWLNKGIAGIWFFADYLDHNLLAYDLMPDSVAQLSSYPSNPDAVLPLPFKALGNAARVFEGATPVGTPRQVGAAAAAADGDGGGIIFRGDATHPDLTYEDALAIFPFQVDPRTFVVAIYVMSRNILQTLPDTEFIVKLTNVDGRAASLRYFDPLTGTNRPVNVIERTASTLVVSLPVGDSPYLLSIAE